MSRSPRIAVGMAMTECNHLGGMPIDIGWFDRQEHRLGADVLRAEAGTLGGALKTLREAGAEPAGLLAASCVCGHTLTADCYSQLKIELLGELRAAGRVDGVLLAMHGSMTAEGCDDTEGDLLAAVRGAVGPEVPIVATLDCHGHVTDTMVHNATAMVAWETYPHRDAYTTGQRGAKLLLDAIAKHTRPVMAMAKVPVIVSGVNGNTEGPGPFADLMRELKSHEGQAGVLSTSLFLVHPFLDVADMGGGALVVADGDLDRATELATRIAQNYWDRRVDFEPAALTPAEAIREGLKIDGGPVLLVETADCCGGGAAGDSVHTLRALLELKPAGVALCMVVDPEAAAACHEGGQGATVTLRIGHKLDHKFGSPLEVTGVVERLTDGRFTYFGGFWDGQSVTMGPSAVLRIGGVRLLVMSLPTYDWADEQYRSAGLDAQSAKFVVAKNPMNYRVGYAGIAKAHLILDTPGPTPATLKHVKYRKLRRPYFPADPEVPGLRPTVYRSRA